MPTKIVSRRPSKKSRKQHERQTYSAVIREVLDRINEISTQSEERFASKFYDLLDGAYLSLEEAADGISLVESGIEKVGRRR